MAIITVTTTTVLSATAFVSGADTVVVNSGGTLTVDVSATFGAAGAALGTDCITVNTGGALLFNAGLTSTFIGDIRPENGPITFKAGTYNWDCTTANRRIKSSSSVTSTVTRVVFDTTGGPITMQRSAGANVWRIERDTANSSEAMCVDMPGDALTTFIDGGSTAAAAGFGSCVIDCWGTITTGANQRIRIKNLKLIRCNGIQVGSFAGSTIDCDIDKVSWISPTVQSVGVSQANGLLLQMSKATASELRRATNIGCLDAGVALLISGKNWVLDEIVCDTFIVTSITDATFTAPTTIGTIVMSTRRTLTTAESQCLVAGWTYNNLIQWNDHMTGVTVVNGFQLSTSQPAGGGTVTITKLTGGAGSPTQGDGDLFGSNAGTTVPITVVIKDAILEEGASGWGSWTFSTHGNKNLRVEYWNPSVMGPGTNAQSGPTAYSSFIGGAGPWLGQTEQFKFYNVLCVRPSVPAAQGWCFYHYTGTRLAGTASAGGANTLTVTSLDGTANERTEDSVGARLDLTVGTGAPATILQGTGTLANGASTSVLTWASPSVTTDATTQYRLGVVDVHGLPGTTFGKAYLFNAALGSLYNADGSLNTASARGIDGLRSSDPAATLAQIIDGGTGNHETQGPKLRSTKRSLAWAATDLYGSTAAGAFTVGGAITAGSAYSFSAAGVWRADAILFRAKASVGVTVANQTPVTGSAWQTNMEYEGPRRLSELVGAATTVDARAYGGGATDKAAAAYRTYVEHGWTPQSATVQGVGSIATGGTRTDMGAVAASVPAVSGTDSDDRRRRRCA